MPVATALFDLRQVKHRDELVLLEAASTVNAAAARRGLEAAQPGMTDHDVLAVIMAELQRSGAEFLSHSLCNHRRGSGTWFAAGTELREGDAFFFDIGCYGPGGYASDIARTGFVGQPPRPVQEAYRVLLDAHRVGQEAARPGVAAADVHEAVNAYLERHGYPRTPYSMGHGVGLRACELPTIHRADRMARNQVLREGMAAKASSIGLVVACRLAPPWVRRTNPAGVAGFGDKQAMQFQNGQTIFYQPDASRADGGYLLPYRLDTTKFNAQAATPTMGYFEREDVPWQQALASAYTVGDHYHCSMSTSTSPNRIMMWTGTNDPDGAHGGPATNNSGDYGYAYTWVTYPESLQKAGVSWQVYVDNDIDSGFFGDFTDDTLRSFAQK